MSLIERFFPVERQGFNFFDRFNDQIKQEFEQMERQIVEMRQRMFQLLPMDDFSDVKDMQIKPTVPIVEEAGQSKLKLEFDVHNFKPEEIQVKVVGNNILQVEAKHEEKTGTSHTLRTYFRQYQLPSGVNSDGIRPQLTTDGVLVVEAAAPSLSPKEKLIPIEFHSSKKS